MQPIIDFRGKVSAVYAEAINLASFGVLTIRRGSHVEPDEKGCWFADLAPVSGPRLGPFAHRSDALDAEQQWLEIYWLPNSASSS